MKKSVLSCRKLIEWINDEKFRALSMLRRIVVNEYSMFQSWKISIKEKIIQQNNKLWKNCSVSFCKKVVNWLDESMTTNDGVNVTKYRKELQLFRFNVLLISWKKNGVEAWNYTITHERIILFHVENDKLVRRVNMVRDSLMKFSSNWN